MKEAEARQIAKIGLDHPLAKAVITLNKEMGMVQGELKWIKILMVGTTVGVLGQLVYSIFGG